VSGRPPSDEGAFQRTSIALPVAPAVTKVIVGAVGGPVGVARTSGLIAPVPAMLRALSAKRYSVPSTRPSTR
jgi:hypothetical protein